MTGLETGEIYYLFQYYCSICSLLLSAKISLRSLSSLSLSSSFFRLIFFEVDDEAKFSY